MDHPGQHGPGRVGAEDLPGGRARVPDPVLLVDEGRLLGSCCQKEIIQALAGKRFEN